MMRMMTVLSLRWRREQTKITVIQGTSRLWAQMIMTRRTILIVNNTNTDVRAANTVYTSVRLLNNVKQASLHRKSRLRLRRTTDPNTWSSLNLPTNFLQLWRTTWTIRLLKHLIQWIVSFIRQCVNENLGPNKLKHKHKTAKKRKPANHKSDVIPSRRNDKFNQT